MNSDPRCELFQVLQELSKVTPDVRLGQLITNLSYRARGATAEAVWDVEDTELLQAAKDQLELLTSKADLES